VTLPAFGQASSQTNTVESKDVATVGESRAGQVQAGGSKEEAGQSKPQENPPEPEAHGTRLRWQDLPKNILHDQKAMWTSPLHINRENAKWWILFGTGTAALLATDRRVSDALPESGTMLNASKWASRLGADYSIYPLTATFYFVGKLGDNPRARDTSRIGIEAIADSEIIVNVLKLATQRPRPEHKGDSLAFWKGGDAFPSGHSIQSWALARVIAREFPHPIILPVLAYGLASTVAVARVGGRRHSPSDAFVGSAMGFFIGDFVYRHHHVPSAKASAALWIANHVNIDVGIQRHSWTNPLLP